MPTPAQMINDPLARRMITRYTEDEDRGTVCRENREKEHGHCSLWAQMIASRTRVESFFYSDYIQLILRLDRVDADCMSLCRSSVSVIRSKYTAWRSYRWALLKLHFFLLGSWKPSLCPQEPSLCPHVPAYTKRSSCLSKSGYLWRKIWWTYLDAIICITYN